MISGNMNTVCPQGKIIIVRNYTVMQFEDDGVSITENNMQENIFSFLSFVANDRIEIIIPQSLPKELLNFYSTQLIRRGFNNFGFLIAENTEQQEEEYYRRVSEAKTLMVTGSPSEVLFFFKNDSISKFVHNKYINDENFTIIGIDDAAILFSDLMLGERSHTSGLGLIKKCMLIRPTDQKLHFRKVVKTLLSNQDLIALTVNDGMFLIIKEGYKAQCIGKSSAMTIHAKNVTEKDMKPFKRGITLYVKNLKGHIFVNQSTLDLRTGEPIKSPHFNFNLNFTNRNTIT